MGGGGRLDKFVVIRMPGGSASESCIERSEMQTRRSQYNLTEQKISDRSEYNTLISDRRDISANE